MSDKLVWGGELQWTVLDKKLCEVLSFSEGLRLSYVSELIFGNNLERVRDEVWIAMDSVLEE